MSANRAIVSVAAGLLGSLVLVGLIAYLFAIGLDKADKVASVASALVGLTSLGLGWVGLVWNHSQGANSRTARSEVSNTIHRSENSYVIQAHTVKTNDRLISQCGNDTVGTSENYEGLNGR